MASVSNKGNNEIYIPQNTYYVPRHSDGKKLSHSEDVIIKKSPTTGLKVGMHKLKNDVFTYIPKGMKGSVNSNFYEFLSTGMVPYIIGSGTLIALSAGANSFFNTQSKHAAGIKAGNVAAGVVLYGLGKWLGSKALNKLTHKSTGIDLEMPYKKIVTELPETPNGKEMVREEFHRVFESKDFFRNDLLLKDGEAKGNRYAFYDEITKKMGYPTRLNAPDQVVNEKIKETIVKATVGKSISSYLWAAAGVALAAQESFGTFKLFGKNVKLPKDFQGNKALTHIKNFGVNIGSTFKSAAKELWNGSKTGNARGTGIVGKALILGALASTVISWLNVAFSFDSNKARGKSEVDFRKDYEGV